ncbi:MAG TPA: phospho-sugar mutase [SAR324 cluster bacterium]|jgi:phosphoglucomutase|nr:phospho-sugar mutase [SAR324 cluster bacterium]MDP6248368.1 phospho-sugar mutase [SAR324 cluster bacterium]MDP7498782.1 phospho-sugar mutase [SAR324 cluster bacterium]MEE1574933.1 phospho-sugar mutase [Deltaproteobacteria bacterium]HJM08439.1 phospho-sugar mutase [SAR324 cluster bacterium]|tara:strand:+ start:24196 stop:25944 length:1749 start_codon:yes stop_codon:yes gene_type:complete
MMMQLKNKVRYWSENECFDPATREQALRMLDENNQKEMEECFKHVLEFGTGGLRGPMGVGTNRMNRYTVMQATEGLARVIELENTQSQNVTSHSGVVIGYDSRNHSKNFAQASAEVLCAHGIKVYLFSEIAPTPLVSCELLRCSARAAIIITASHNPPSDNGYKVYWSHGGQIIPPVDGAIIQEVKKISRIEDIPVMNLDEAETKGLLQFVQEEADQYYFEQVEPLAWGNLKFNCDYGVVYTPFHGTGGRLVPELLKRRKFECLKSVTEQMVPDGNFPTLASPNPEDPKAFEMALEQADESDELILANDPDADRLGVMIRGMDRNWQWLNGNQIGVLLLDQMLSTLQEKEEIPKNGVLVTTIVSSPLMGKVARFYGLEVIQTLTGFKWIRDAALGAEKSGKEFLFGMEESHGYLSGSHTGDKDGIWAAMAFAEMGAFFKSQGKTPLDHLALIHQRHGIHLDSLFTINHPGEEGKKKIRKMMDDLRQNPPSSFGRLRTLKRIDIFNDVETDLLTKSEKSGPGLPQSNVILLELEKGNRIIARPSGTEPKIKFYFNLCGADMEGLENLMSQIKQDLQNFQESFL